MAARRHQKLLDQTYRLLADDLRRVPPSAATAVDELQEADVWGVAEEDPATDEPVRSPVPARGRRGRAAAVAAAEAARSVPVEVPGWGRKEAWEEGDSDGEGGEVVPPHVYLWRRRRAADEVAAFSVEEGWGRTLKGRDLSRVRNAVWEKIGFID